MPDPTPSQPAVSAAPPQRKVRWWPALLILVLAAGAVVWIRAFYGRQFQDKNIATAQIVVFTILALLLWCLLLSRLRWKIRLAVLGFFLCAVASLPALFRIHGVTGDLLPVLEPRWSRHGLASLAAPSQASRSHDATAALSLTNDYPQFLGPNRNATVEQPQLATDWNARPPQRLWSQPVGLGWSGFAVVGNHAITQEQRGEQEAVLCYDLLSGAVLWSYGYPAHFVSSLAGEGPRATPSVVSNRVYTLGSTGILNCLHLETGRCLWTKDILRDNDAPLNEWGMASSPLVVDDLVIVSAGGKAGRSLVAYRAENGQFVWGGGEDGAGYSSPQSVTLAGVPQIVIFNSGGVFAHSPADGKVLWHYHWPGGHPHVAVPLALPGDRVFISSGYGVGGELVQITKDNDGKFTAARLWKSNRLKAKFTNVVYRDGFIYGLDDGIMVCLDAANGELKWKQGRYGHGQEILVKDLLLVGGESGEVLMLEPRPDGPRELTRFSALSNKTWNPPALAGPYLVVRNDKEAACYRLPLR